MKQNIHAFVDCTAETSVLQRCTQILTTVLQSTSIKKEHILHLCSITGTSWVMGYVHYHLWFVWSLYVCVCVFMRAEFTGGSERGSDQTAGGSAETDRCDWFVPQSHDSWCPARKGRIHPWTPGSHPQRTAGWVVVFVCLSVSVTVCKTLFSMLLCSFPLCSCFSVFISVSIILACGIKYILCLTILLSSKTQCIF